MRLLGRRYLVPIRPFLIRNFPVFIGVIFSGIFSTANVVVLVENYYLPSLSSVTAVKAGVALALFITF